MMRQRGAAYGGGGGGPPKLPRGSLGLGGLIIAGGIAIFAINASIFNGLTLIFCNKVNMQSTEVIELSNINVSVV